MERSDFRGGVDAHSTLWKAILVAGSILALFPSRTAFAREGGDPFNPGDVVREQRTLRKAERDLAQAPPAPADERESGNWKMDSAPPGNATTPSE